MRTWPVMSAAYAVRGSPAAPNGRWAIRPSGCAREDRPPLLELVHVVGRLVAEDLDRVLVPEVVGALHGVERVLLGIVLRGVPERGVDAPLGRARVASHRVDLRQQGDVRTRVERFDRRAHPGAAGSDDHDIVNRVHYEGRYLIVPGSPPSNPQRRTKVARALDTALIGTVHVVFAAATDTAPGAKLPASRRCRGQPHRRERGEGRRAARPAGDARARAPHRAASRHRDGQAEGRGCEEGGHARARSEIHEAASAPGARAGPAHELRAGARCRREREPLTGVPGRRAAGGALQAGNVGRRPSRRPTRSPRAAPGCRDARAMRSPGVSSQAPACP